MTDYLWDEVLVKQAPATRMFLLRTCIAGQVSGDLADALTGQSGSARTLDRLSRENRYLAFGKVGIQRPSRSIVFQPT